jgi:ABC-type Zn uptake system ZnuABC Zn-binding protein ZnuA
MISRGKSQRIKPIDLHAAAPAAESHSFEPTPQDILRIQSCDLFLYVGGESDAWVDRVLSSMDIGKARF